MNLHHLKVFHAVAHAENFSHAAGRLYISQPAVSVQVKRLEEALGVPLVEVYGRRVHLTEAGKRLKEFADQILRLECDAEEALAEYQDPGRGRIRVGASTTPGTYLLPGAIAAFRRGHPGVEVIPELGNTRAIEQRLLTNDLDLGIIGEDYAGEHGLLLQPWICDQLVIIAPPDHALGKAGAISAQRLCEEPWILREPGSSTREVFAARAKALGLTFPYVLELASTEAIKEAVAAGLGLAAVSRFSIPTDLRAGRLMVLNVPQLRPERRLYLARHKGKRLSRGGAAFLQFLKESQSALSGLPHEGTTATGAENP